MEMKVVVKYEENQEKSITWQQEEVSKTYIHYIDGLEEDGTVSNKVYCNNNNVNVNLRNLLLPGYSDKAIKVQIFQDDVLLKEWDIKGIRYFFTTSRPISRLSGAEDTVAHEQVTFFLV